MNRTLIIGATSSIAQETARLLATEGASFFLTARNPERLQAVADDLGCRGAAFAHTTVMDAMDFERHEEGVETAFETLGGVDLAIIAHGLLPDQNACQESHEEIRKTYEVNTLSVFSLLTHIARRMEAVQGGTILVISSVAGDRGRPSNYVYGSSKAALDAFLQGLRSRLDSLGVRVITVKPGFVDTPMTQHMKKGFLWAEPEQIASGIVRAVRGSRDVVYLPWFWRWIMLVVRLIPERIFKKLDF